MTIIENLWEGNITPGVRSVAQDSEFQKLGAASVDCEDIFTAELSDEGKQAYEEYCDLIMKQADISERDAFVKGFRLGALLLLELLNEEKTQLPPIAG